jgi:ABC-type Fe3+-hydroxamate transport system substrate-binding protein
MRSSRWQTLDDYTVPSGGCIEGNLTKIGDTVGFYFETKYAGAAVAVVIQCDIAELTKKTGSLEAIAQGAKVYYEAASGKLTGVSGGNTLCGRALKAAGAAATTAFVAFNGHVAA